MMQPSKPSKRKDTTKRALEHAHDKFARYMLSQPAIALDFLKSYIPADVLPLFKLSTLRVENGSFLEQELQQTHTDILYSLEIENLDQPDSQTTPGYIYIVVEHQSSIDSKMPGRMLSYQAQIARQHYEKNGRFPQILPVIYYCGQTSPYPEKHSHLANYLDNRSLGDHLINPNIIIIDLTTKSYAQLAMNNHLSGLEIVLKHAQDRNRRAAIDFLLNNTCFELICTSKDILIAIFTYISQHDDDMQFFKELTNRTPKKYKKDMITIAEQLRREGKREGMLQGITKGKREGKLEGQKQIIQQLARSGLSLDFIAKHTRLTVAQVNQLLDRLD